MPPKRKTTDSDQNDVKKTKTIAEIDGAEVRFEWEGDEGKWTSYCSDLNLAISEAHNGDYDELEFSIAGKAKIRVLLGKMVQKNKTTGWERRLRCCMKKDNGYHCWEYEDEHGHWNPYNVTTCLQLDKAQAGGDSTLSIEAAGIEYTIDISGLTQSDDDTGVERKIRKVTSSAILADAGDNASIVISQPKKGRKAPAKSGAAKSGAKASKSAANGKGSASAAANGSTSKSSGKSGRRELVNIDENGVKTVVVKGVAPVDPECVAKQGVAHVYSQGKDIYDVMLNQTNVGNNNNKYFIIQLLEDDGRKSYSVWFRWGRVGYKGQSNLVPCGPDLDEAKKVFCKKFSDKTKNDWADRKSFQKVAGKYDLVAIDYGVDNSKAVQPKNKPENVPPSKLPKNIQDLINLICDVKTMEDMVLEMKYDSQKAPLGKLTPQQIKAGYSALKRIDTCITNKSFGSALNEACSDFYTRIPHDFGMSRPPLIRTKDEVKAKIKLLEVLNDIEIAMKILNETVANENPVDTHYNKLNCDLEPLDHDNGDFQMIEDYLKNTHATTHNQYNMSVLDVFSMDKHGEDERFNNIGNSMLLWHGSRITNWMGILSQGLRIAPPEAPVTGYMFGKGVYFADMSSKSANYCFANRSNNTGLLLLCEVALGDSNDLLAADYEADQLPSGKQSVRGLGKIAPDPSDNFTMSDGTIVPMGKAINTGVTNPKGYTLNYNEYIVYNTNQIKMKYLVKVKFNFN